MVPSSVGQKAGATVVTVAAAMALAAPVWPLAGFEWWRAATLWLFALTVGRAGVRDLGCWTVGIRYRRRPSQVYVALYIVGFATALYWIWVPGDLLALNLSAQAVCLWRTGNTLHGWLTGVWTVRG
jgi:hypothetical protein